jgi:four helix bundle protein
MMEKMQSPLVIKSTQLAVRILLYCDELASQKKFEVAKQLLRSGTSIGANINEAQHAESKVDFVHKLKISAKECSETEFWLKILDEAYQINDEELVKLNNEIAKMLSSAIATTKDKISKTPKLAH